MDLYTLTFITMALAGLVTSEAVWSASTLSVSISVPPRVESIGFTRQAAEEVFAAEVKRIVDAPSTISRPSTRISSRKTVVGVISESLQLRGLTSAIQDSFGQETLHVTGALMKEEGDYRLVLLVSEQNSIPIQLDLRREDNDVVALLRDGATATFERIAPYRVALSRFLAGIKGDDVQLARASSDTRNALKIPAPVGRETEWAGLNTLDALQYLIANDPAAAKAAFRRAYLDPNISAGAKAVGQVNYSFMAIHDRQPDAALRYARAARTYLAGLTEAPWNFEAYVDVAEGLALWSTGDREAAARFLAAAERKMPRDETPVVYLVRLWSELNRPEEAVAARARLDRAGSFSGEIPAMAISLFWIDPETGKFERRNR
ncbi:MAG: hypothetical protein RLO51_10485 [Thalassobaculum sp.]|uniref:hypothetical protein n=1 Tax=Thalassobaculum sp. TaxID=2022740 RepID=UPI0032EB8BC5